MTSLETTTPEKAIEPEYRAILRKASYILLTIGVIDIAWTVYRFANNADGSITINLVYLVCGLLLLWGGLRVASAIRWLTVLALGAYVASMLAVPIVQPWDLSLVQLRLAPQAFVYSLAYSLFIVALMLWLVFTLGKPAIVDARAAAGRPRRDMRIPAALGVGSMLVILVLTLLMLNGETANKAKVMAEQQTGPGYRYRVLAIQESTQSVTAIVTAWNDEQVGNIQVNWEKP